MSEWRYARRNSKGEVKFRKDTKQSAEHVMSVLDERDIEYVYIPSATMFFIYKKPKGENGYYSPRYAYYYTTGKWGGSTRKKHYHSNGIEDFLERYYETYEQTKARFEEKTDEQEADR
jgi:hypothetical protein